MRSTPARSRDPGCREPHGLPEVQGGGNGSKRLSIPPERNGKLPGDGVVRPDEVSCLDLLGVTFVELLTDLGSGRVVENTHVRQTRQEDVSDALELE